MQEDFRWMRKVQGFYSSMAAKGLSHFFQKDKVLLLFVHFFVFSKRLESTLNYLSFRLTGCTRVFVLLELCCVWKLYKTFESRYCVSVTSFCSRYTTIWLISFYLLDLPSKKEDRRRHATLRTSQTVQGSLVLKLDRRPIIRTVWLDLHVYLNRSFENAEAICSKLTKQLWPFKASLHSGINLKECVKLPADEDLNDWVAVHSKFIIESRI